MLLTHIPSTTASYCEDADDGSSSSPSQPSSSLLVASIFSITADQQVEQEFEQFKQSLDHQMLLESTANNNSIVNGNIHQSMEHHRHQAHHQQSQVKRELLMTININDKQGSNYAPRVCASCNNCITDDFYLRTTPVEEQQAVKREAGQQQQQQSKYGIGTGNGTIGHGNCLSWHTNRGCLRCSRCGQPLEGQSSCFMSNGNILCKSDYEYLTSKENSNSLEDQWMLPPRYRCFRCFAFFGPSEFVIKVPMPNGQCLMTGPWMFFHTNCFSCDYCGKQLNKGNLYSLDGTKVLCPLHAGKVAAGSVGGGTVRASKGNKDASSVTRSPLCQTSSFSMSRSAPVKSPKKRGPKAGSTRGPRSKKLLSSLVGEATSTSTTAARNVSPTVTATSEALASTPAAVSPSASSSCTSSSFQFSQANPSRKYDSTSTKNGQ